MLKEMMIYNFLVVLLLLTGCARTGEQLGTDDPKQPDTSLATYTNPVFEPILADPTVIRDPQTGFFYAYGTQDNWGDGQGSRLVPILRSTNLVDWQVVGQAFEEKHSWKEAGGILAPDVRSEENTSE